MVKNTFNKKIVVIHSHPDDTEAFCAGTLKLLKDKGYEITIVTLTGGGLGGVNMSEEETVHVRASEAQEAAAVLDAKYISLGYRDGFLFDSEEARLKVIELLRREKAGIVFTHLPNDYHSDHRTTCQIVEIAAMVSTLANAPSQSEPLEITPLLYHTATITLTDQLGSPIDEPHFYVDISTSIDTKMEMLAKHHSQHELMKHMHKMDNFFELMREYNEDLGERIGAKYAEVFWQHLGGGFQKDDLIQNELSDFIVYNTLDQFDV